MIQDARHEIGQSILVSRRGILAIKPRLVPILGVTRQASIREDGVSSSLDGDSAKFQDGPVCILVWAVQIGKLLEEFDTGLHLKVYFTEDLKVANV